MYTQSSQIDGTIALKTEHVTKIFESAAGRAVALRDTNFMVKRGEFVSIMGHLAVENLHFSI